MYDLLLKIMPFVSKWSFPFSILLFFFWLFQRNSKIYAAYIQDKAISDYQRALLTVEKFNFRNSGKEVQISSSWLDRMKVYRQNINNTLLLSLCLAYISFNSDSFARNDTENFFKWLTISTTLFLAGITYIQQQYRE